jgi:hypothetical protein
VTRAAKQRDTKKLLQTCDLSRHGALRHRQFLSCARVALVACRGFKAGEGLQGWDLSAHDVRNIHNILRKMEVLTEKVD